MEENRKIALRHAKESLQKGADVVLFHEELLIGCTKNVRELAEPLDGPTTRAFQTLLQDSKALVICGLQERDGDRYYIAATVIGAGGVVANYHKTHLFWKADGPRCEPSIYTPGDRLVTFDLQGHKSGLMICYDGDFPEMARSYANLDCRLLFWMNNRPSRGHEEVKPLAEANSIIMATSCCCGVDEGGRKCSGGSNITDAQGKLLAEIREKEGVIYADVPARGGDAHPQRKLLVSRAAWRPLFLSGQRCTARTLTANHTAHDKVCKRQRIASADRSPNSAAGPRCKSR